MKKILLSAGTIITFGLYCIFVRQSSTRMVVTTVPNTQPAADTQTPATSAPNTNPTLTPRPTQPPTTPAAAFRDGTYVGNAANAFYGNVRVEAIIQSGKISDVRFLQYPNDRPLSTQISQHAMPILIQEAVQAQSAQVDGVTGATDTSQAFVESLSSALAKAQNA